MTNTKLIIRTYIIKNRLFPSFSKARLVTNLSTTIRGLASPRYYPRLNTIFHYKCIVCVLLLSLLHSSHSSKVSPQQSRPKFDQELLPKRHNVRRVEVSSTSENTRDSYNAFDIIPDCYDKLRNASGNSTNMTLSHAEYNVFFNNISNDYFLNKEFEVNTTEIYNQLVCKYHDIVFNDKTNCRARSMIPIDAIDLDYDIQTDEQILYLFQVCEKSKSFSDEIKIELLRSKSIESDGNGKTDWITSLGTGTLAGIASAVAVILIVSVSFLFVHRRRERDKMIQVEMETTFAGGRKSFIPFVNIEGGYSEDGINESNSQNCSISDEGGSGWSSSQGISVQSSLNASSMESSDHYHTSLLKIGKESGDIARLYSEDDHGVGNSLQFVPKLTRANTDQGRGISREKNNVLYHQPVSRVDLDKALVVGDWAAVGKTAAILAQSPTSCFAETPRSSLSTCCNSVHRSRAQELDQLVDSGDWEAVVLLAAEFEAQTDTDGYGSKSLSSCSEQLLSMDRSSNKSDNSVSAASVYSGESDESGETPSKAQKRAEIRLEVETLVRRLVPDEIDNIDEMMLQFRGREDELVEALRTMQERNIAKRARAAQNRVVKMEVKKNIKNKRQGLPPSGPRSVLLDRQGKVDKVGVIGTAGTRSEITPMSRVGNSVPLVLPPLPESEIIRDYNDVQSLTSLVSTASGNKSCRSMSSTSRAALEIAIEKGDWDAVGEAAAKMNDGSESSVATSDFGESVGESTMSSSMLSKDSSGEYSRSTYSGSKGGRIDDLEKLIDKGDWSAVVAVANRYSTLKNHSARSSVGSSSNANSRERKKSWKNYFFGNKKSTSVASNDESSLNSRKPSTTLQDEHDALAQANLWAAIAAQSKGEESSASKGARDAADWAIDRSLSALRHIDESGINSSDSRKKFDAGSSTHSLDSSNCDISV